MATVVDYYTSRDLDPASIFDCEDISKLFASCIRMSEKVQDPTKNLYRSASHPTKQTCEELHKKTGENIVEIYRRLESNWKLLHPKEAKQEKEAMKKVSHIIACDVNTIYDIAKKNNLAISWRRENPDEFIIFKDGNPIAKILL